MAEKGTALTAQSEATLQPTHFLHIGKTGGSAIQAALQPFAKTHALIFHKHKITLRDIPTPGRVVFFVRDPVMRFVSAFNSRLRQGRPRYDVAWKDDERIAFEIFPTANILAEALSSEIDVRREQAVAAMKTIQHLRSPQTEWLGDAAYLRSQTPRIFFAGFQETLGQDFEALKSRLGIPREAVLPTDPIAMHATPSGYETALSDLAIANIREWYAEDMPLLDVLREFRRSQSRLP